MTKIGLKFRILCFISIALGLTCIYYGILSGII